MTEQNAPEETQFDDDWGYYCDSCGNGPFLSVSVSSGPEPFHTAGWECPACGAFNADEEMEDDEEDSE
jgi:hypothetical protein